MALSDVYIAERPDPHDDRVQTLAVWKGGALDANFSYSLAEAEPCHTVYEQERAIQLHLSPTAFHARSAMVIGSRLPIRYYAGIPLIGSQKTVIGHMAVMNVQPIASDLIPILQIFAARASAELERMRATAAQNTMEERYRQLFENSPQPILVFDIDTLRYTDVNDSACALYGYDRGEFMTLTALDLRPNGEVERFYATLRTIVDCGAAYTGVWKHRRKDGAILDVECRCCVFRVGARCYMMSLITDVSERARLEEERQNAAIEERTRIARELHDSVNQTLWSSALIADVLPQLWEQNAENGQHKLAQLRQLNRTALAEMRTLLLELRPAAVLEASLGDLLNRLVEAMLTPLAIDVQLDLAHDDAVPAEVKVALYRIAQEALNNVVRHAGARKVQVTLGRTETGLRLAITDDGRGFTQELLAVRPREHMGLHIMRERAEAIDAQLTINGRAGKGTTVTVLWQD
jgi:PAS domain S-box-containing protein